ncbi:MAG: type II toxin-antitoxin system prevent-host-death family antitoxin [Gaiellaceae bacterium]
MGKLTATEAARNFSALLNRVAAGEEIEIVRSGAPVAVISPPRIRFLSAERLRELLASAPPVDEDFADDLRALRADVGPPEDAWPS